MRALTFTAYKRPLQETTAPEPAVGDHDVLVKVQAAGLNQLDEKIRTGEFKQFLHYSFPLTLGHDMAGTVIQIGALVRQFSIGDEVYARPRDGRIGTFAERISVHEDDVALRPTSINIVEAGSLPLVALTAWQALVERANVQPGQKVLITPVPAGSGRSPFSSQNTSGRRSPRPRAVRTRTSFGDSAPMSSSTTATRISSNCSPVTTWFSTAWVATTSKSLFACSGGVDWQSALQAPRTQPSPAPSA